MKKIKIVVSLKDAREAQNRIADDHFVGSCMIQQYSNTYVCDCHNEEEDEEVVSEIQNLLNGLEFEITDI